MPNKPTIYEYEPSVGFADDLEVSNKLSFPAKEKKARI
jgi:hypothetical protein